jgi:hypothetical protein
MSHAINIRLLLIMQVQIFTIDLVEINCMQFMLTLLNNNH